MMRKLPETLLEPLSLPVRSLAAKLTVRLPLPLVPVLGVTGLLFVSCVKEEVLDNKLLSVLLWKLARLSRLFVALPVPRKTLTLSLPVGPPVQPLAPALPLEQNWFSLMLVIFMFCGSWKMTTSVTCVFVVLPLTVTTFFASFLTVWLGELPLSY